MRIFMAACTILGLAACTPPEMMSGEVPGGTAVVGQPAAAPAKRKVTPVKVAAKPATGGLEVIDPSSGLDSSQSLGVVNEDIAVQVYDG